MENATACRSTTSASTSRSGTVGALSLIDGLDEDFLVMNGDVLTDLDYRVLLNGHRAGGQAATIAAHRREVQISLGVMHFDDDADPASITDYSEKPTLNYEVSMGVYCFAPRAIKLITPGERLDFPDLVLRLIAAGEKVMALRSESYWLDIGRHDDYEQAQDEFNSRRHQFLPDS